MRVLFVCTQNLQRSPTAAALYRVRPDLEVRSAGIAPDARVPLTAELVRWAEIVFVMEDFHRVHLRHRFPALVRKKRVVCLDVPDAFYYMDPELVRLLAEKLRPYLRERGPGS